MANTSNISSWLNDNLSEVLAFPVPPDLSEYILTIENDRDLHDYLKTLLDFNNPRHRAFVEKYKIIRHSKNDNDNDDDDEFGGAKKKKNLKATSKKPDTKNVASINKNNKENENKDGAKPKKKNKFVNLYSKEGEAKDVIFLKGRHLCECQASKHKLINNCLKCGRIVCTQEGSGPCLFCGTLVCSAEENDIINSNTKQGKKLYDNLMSNDSSGLEKALAQRDKLLEYDKTTGTRSKVIDDECDYFSTNSSWLSKEEREKLKKKEEEMHAKKHKPRSEKKMTLDLSGGKLVEEEDVGVAEEQYYREALECLDEIRGESQAHPDFSMSIQPVFVSDKDSKDFPALEEKDFDSKQLNYKVQDRELLLISDNGACLSMHQPWASLLVRGIKKDEGRTWYTSHRGRLWIASASKVPSEETIKDCEAFYKTLTGNENLKFPTSYPVGCLLGCVSLVDCLPQEEYREKYPNGESESPFVLVCEEHTELDIKFPMSGSHKIYKMDSRIHQAARKALIRLSKSAR